MLLSIPKVAIFQKWMKCFLCLFRNGRKRRGEKFGDINTVNDYYNYLGIQVLILLMGFNFIEFNLYSNTNLVYFPPDSVPLAETWIWTLQNIEEGQNTISLLSCHIRFSCEHLLYFPWLTKHFFPWKVNTKQLSMK